MTTSKFISIFLIICVYSCGQKTAKEKINPAAIKLNDTAMKLVHFIDNADSCKKAILLLDSATVIDSSYFLGYYNKLLFLNHLKQYDKAIITINNLIRIKPFAYDLYLTGGLFCERIRDTVSSKIYFQKSLKICDAILDTMNFDNDDYNIVLSNKSANLVMLNEQQKAKQILAIINKRIRKGEPLQLSTKKDLVGYMLGD